MAAPRFYSALLITFATLALLIRRALRSVLFEISPTDPVTLAAVALLMGAAAVAASLVPAWRAARAGRLEAIEAE